ncbi:MAG: hypothetical protein JWN70_3444 [Planctomycetaceae bacterium]|nr:hypothetical protein [Planctomycetaceae bacterium]
MADEQEFENEDVESEEIFENNDESLFARSSEFGEPDDLSTDDLEEAYLKALAAMESAEWAVSESGDEAEAEPAADDSPEPALTPLAPVGVEIAGADFLSGESVASDQPSAVDVSSNAIHTEAPVESHQPRTSAATSTPVRDPTIKPLRVIEACLFVGGQPLSAKKLAGLLDGNNEASDIETLIDELNLEYAAQGRPYEIRLVDGGYKLTLRAEFEAIRSRVYGVGPRDVKLSQDVLEVLALVAYQQPITQAAVEACKPNSANILRQLLRRELISLNRVDQSRKGVEYHTTPRFLQLFGLAQLNELPRPEDLSIR